MVDGCSVVVETGTVLSKFASVFPNDNLLNRHTVSNNKVYGTVVEFFTYRCNGNKNYAEVSNNYVEEIANGVMGDKALVYVTSNGFVTPYFAYTTAYGNRYGGINTVAIVRDQITSVGMDSSLSAWGNYNFANDIAIPSAGVSGFKANQVARLGKITGDEGLSAYFNVISKVIAAGATQTFDVSNTNGCLLFIQGQVNNTAYALIASSGTANAVISKGALFEVGNTTDPGTGFFRVWSSGTRQISIRNTDSSNYAMSVFVMAPS